MTKSFLKKKKQNPAIFTWYMLGGKIIKKKIKQQNTSKKKMAQKPYTPIYFS